MTEPNPASQDRDAETNPVPASQRAHPHDHNLEKDPALFRREPVSFVRRGARLNRSRQGAWDRMADTVLVPVPRDRADTSVARDAVFDWTQIFGQPGRMLVDIGCGQGESTAQGAADRPDWNVLAVEVYVPGLAGLMGLAERGELTNIRAVEANAPEVLDHLLPAGGVDEVWVFFPDPWHKSRHHKRRLVSPAFADRLARVLAPGGLIRLATDWSDYAVQMRTVFESDERFENLHPGERAGTHSPLTRVRAEGLEKQEPLPAEDALDAEGGWSPRFAGRPLTSFEAKSQKAGRLVFDLTYRRV